MACGKISDKKLVFGANHIILTFSSSFHRGQSCRKLDFSQRNSYRRTIKEKGERARAEEMREAERKREREREGREICPQGLTEERKKKRGRKI